jgi:hypothetical protein
VTGRSGRCGLCADEVEEAIERFSQTGSGDVKMPTGERTEAARGTLASSFHL